MQGGVPSCAPSEGTARYHLIELLLGGGKAIAQSPSEMTPLYEGDRP
ncbi:MAG: hypothetical protein SFY66_21335 [Oculatellaceae cyanobacterium bins.114]|nr:hypothetical protein [Oculatellaceae cyanobacterium bins.114]